MHSLFLLLNVGVESEPWSHTMDMKVVTLVAALQVLTRMKLSMIFLSVFSSLDARKEIIDLCF